MVSKIDRLIAVLVALPIFNCDCHYDRGPRFSQQVMILPAANNDVQIIKAEIIITGMVVDAMEDEAGTAVCRFSFISDMGRKLNIADQRYTGL